MLWCVLGDPILPNAFLDSLTSLSAGDDAAFLGDAPLLLQPFLSLLLSCLPPLGPLPPFPAPVDADPMIFPLASRPEMSAVVIGRCHLLFLVGLDPGDIDPDGDVPLPKPALLLPFGGAYA